MLSYCKKFFQSSPALKALGLRLLMPAHQPRPRTWVRWLVNPWVHRKGKGALVRNRTRMDVLPNHRFVLGAYATIEDFATVNNGVGDVLIGSRTRIGISNVIIGPVQVGNDVMLAPNVVVSALNHGYEDVHTPISAQPVVTKAIVIEDEVWIGANSVITAGVTIGRHAVVAAGSVVTKNVPAYSVVAGNPARIVKEFDFDEGAWVRAANESSAKKVPAHRPG